MAASASPLYRRYSPRIEPINVVMISCRFVCLTPWFSCKQLGDHWYLSRKPWMSGGTGPSISLAFERISAAIAPKSVGVGALPPFAGCAISARKRRTSCHEREALLHAADGPCDSCHPLCTSRCLASKSSWAAGQHELQ